MLRLTAIACRRSSNISITGLRSLATYKEEKLAAKERRREAWTRKDEKLALRPERRKGREDRGMMRKAFREWHDKRRVYHEILDKLARRQGLDWKIRVAAVLERIPTKLAKSPQWEEEYLELQEYLDQFEGLDYPPELKIPDEDEDAVRGDDEDEEEIDDDIRNQHRRPDKRLFLALKDDNSNWQFPTVEVKEGQTLNEGAKEMILNMFEPDANIISMGNCPIGVYLDKYDNPTDGYFGEKTFYMKLQIQEGLIKGNDNNYGWPDRSEISESNHASSEKLYRYML